MFFRPIRRNQTDRIHPLCWTKQHFHATPAIWHQEVADTPAAIMQHLDRRRPSNVHSAGLFSLRITDNTEDAIIGLHIKIGRDLVIIPRRNFFCSIEYKRMKFFLPCQLQCLVMFLIVEDLYLTAGRCQSSPSASVTHAMFSALFIGKEFLIFKIQRKAQFHIQRGRYRR